MKKNNYFHEKIFIFTKRNHRIRYNRLKDWSCDVKKDDERM